MEKFLVCKRFEWKPWGYDRAPLDLIAQWKLIDAKLEARLAELRKDPSRGATPDHPVTVETPTGTATTYVCYFDEPP